MVERRTEFLVRIFVALLILTGALVTIASANAQQQGIERHVEPPDPARKRGAPSQLPAAVAAPQIPDDNLVTDGGFEAGTPNPYWSESSSNFGTPICDEPGCGTGTGSGPRSGAFWAWFGGIDDYEQGSLSQSMVIPSGTATLSFWLEIPVCDSAADYLEVKIDNTRVFVVNGASARCGQWGTSSRRSTSTHGQTAATIPLPSTPRRLPVMAALATSSWTMCGWTPRRVVPQTHPLPQRLQPEHRRPPQRERQRRLPRRQADRLLSQDRASSSAR